MSGQDHRCDRPFAGLAAGLRTHYCGELGLDHVDISVSVCGWVAHRREHGEHLAFIDVRDHTGIIQCVVDGDHALRSEYVVRVTGTVRPRPEGTRNDALSTGAVELGDCEVEVLSVAEPPPFSIDRVEADESVRLRFRYLDLRTDRMQANLRLRALVCATLRATMAREGFLELETPLLWTPTPEGAREFAIPSRLQHGSFYVLPQSPQIAKQLSMVGGIDRYFQIARCMRDEDLRSDRQFEFSQLDLEASFVTQQDIWRFVSSAVIDATIAATGEAPPEIVTMSWADAIDTYGTNKPDLRFSITLCDLGGALKATEFRAFAGAPCIKAIVLPGGADLGRGRLDALVKRAQDLGAKGMVWMRVVAGDPDGLELDSPVARFLSAEERQAIVANCQAGLGDLLLIVADEYRVVCSILGQLRVDLGRAPVAEGPKRFCWVVQFPLFDGVDELGNPITAAHPFTMPFPEDLELLESDPLSVRAQSYDLVLNGWELGSGSIRIHRADIQRRVFAALGMDESEAESRFGFLLEAFRYGTPPHGGFAVGIDRFVAILAGEENIREVIAFPKTQSGADLMTGAPRPLGQRQLNDLGIRVVVPPKRPNSDSNG